jgi:ssDNA-binding Zn-finger/Zn-ribbon topoisomerase 1
MSERRERDDEIRNDLAAAGELRALESTPTKPHEHDVTCHCGSKMRLRYSQRFGGNWFYGCSRFPECDGAHGAHQSDGAPLGVPADKPTKAARIRAHTVFNQLFEGRGRMTRSQAYRWLAKKLHMTADECHIGRFNLAQCDRVIDVCARRLGRGFGNG